MIPYFVFDHFNIGPLRFHTWGFFVGLAFSAGFLYVLYRVREINPPTPLSKGGEGGLYDRIIALCLSIFVGAAIGSRLLFLMQTPTEFLSNIGLLWRFDMGGMMLYGGIIGGILGGWLYLNLTPLRPPLQGGSFWRLADLATPAIALGIAIGYIGCSLINDHVGSPTNLPWAILWPDGILRHPVAEYMSLAGFGLFGIFWWLQKYNYKILPNPPLVKEGTTASPPFRKGRLGGILQLPGNLFLLFLATFSLVRFLLDFLRASDGIYSDPHWWGLTSSQWISISVLTFIVIHNIIIRYCKKL